MKKNVYLLLALTCMCLFSACEKESYRHGAAVIYPLAGTYHVVFADQTSDSIVFTTFDSYRSVTKDAWIEINPKMQATVMPNAYYYNYKVSLPITFSPNTTGEVRYGLVNITSYSDDWSTTISSQFMNVSWLDVTNPAPAYEYDANRLPKSASFVADNLSAEGGKFTLVFNTFSNYTIEMEEGSFLTADKLSGEKGENKVTLSYDAITDGLPRTTALTITSNGVSSKVTFKQTEEKKEL